MLQLDKSFFTLELSDNIGSREWWSRRLETGAMVNGGIKHESQERETKER
jgi:hypothetical protein